jgi:hypothetical protein
MMRRLIGAALALAAAALLVPAALAQQDQQRPRRGGQGGGMLSRLFENKDVQKELKLTDEQAEKAQKVAKDVADKHKDDFAKLQDVPMEERFAKMRELGQQVTDETIKDLSDTLKPEQIKRLKQIMLQMRVRSPFGGGVSVFLDPEVQKELKLTDKQKDDLKTMAEDARKEAQEIFQNAGGNRQEAGQKLRELQKEKMENAEALLTADQKKSWKDMQGDPVEIRLGGPGGRGGNRPNRNNNNNQ